MNDLPEDVRAALAARARAVACREQIHDRALHDPVAHAVLTMLRRVADEAEQPDRDLDRVLADATAAVMALVDASEGSGYDRAVENLLDREKWRTWWMQQAPGVGSAVTDLAGYLRTLKETNA